MKRDHLADDGHEWSAPMLLYSRLAVSAYDHIAKVINRCEAVDFHHASVGVKLGRSSLWTVADVLQALEQRGLK